VVLGGPGQRTVSFGRHDGLRSSAVPIDIPRDALVVRGGDPHDPENLQRMIDQAQTSFDDGEGYALSVGVGHDPSKSRSELIVEIARACKLPQGRLSVTTYGQLVDAELFNLHPDGPLPSHANIDLGSELSEDVVKDLIGLFGEAEVNPVHSEFRRRR
jgi:hypothetical protein